MLTKEELKIIELFKKNLLKSYTIREIQKAIAKQSYNWVFKAVKKLELSKIIEIRMKGHSSLCSLDINDNLALIYLSLIEEFALRRKKLPTQNIAELIGSIPLSYFTFIVAGSFAQGKATKKSDLDIVVIVEDGINTSKILAILKNKGELMIPEAHPYVFTKSEFLQMLMSHEENYGKMVYRNRLIAFGAHNYYLIIREAIKNGFKG
jgi:predicted nucleotidyltransferase